MRLHQDDYTAHAAVLTYCLNHCAGTCHSRLTVTRCRFTNQPANQVPARHRTVHFLSTNLISFRRSRGIVFVMAAPAREMDSRGRQWNTEKDMRNVWAHYSKVTKRRQQKLFASTNVTRWCTCVPTGSWKSACFGALRTVIDHVTGRQRAA